MKTVALISNPRSHRVATRGSVLAEVAARKTSALYIELDDFNAIGEQVLGVARAGVSTIVIEGGDGTLEAILSACLWHLEAFREPPQFAVLPGGSTNLAFKVMGLRRATADYVVSRLDRIAGTEPVHRSRHRTLIVEADSLPGPVAGFLLSTGSLARAMTFAQAEIHGDTHRGVLSVAQAAARLALWPRSTMAEDGSPVIRVSQFERLDEDPTIIDQEQAFSLFTTLPGLSLGLKPFWNRGDHPISYSWASWPIPNLRQGVGKLLLGAGEKEMTAHGMKSFGISDMTFKCDGPVMLDGECLPQPADGVFRISPSAEWDFIR